MSPMLLSWPMMSEADVGGMAIEVEPSHQYPITFCCRATDGSTGVVWQNGVWHESAWEEMVCHWIPPCGKHGTHWHSLMLAECFWRPNSGYEHSEAVGGVFHQWWQRCESQAMTARLSHQKMKSISIVICRWEFALTSSIIVVFVSVVVSMEINRKHYFLSDLHI